MGHWPHSSFMKKTFVWICYSSAFVGRICRGVLSALTVACMVYPQIFFMSGSLALIAK